MDVQIVIGIVYHVDALVIKFQSRQNSVLLTGKDSLTIGNAVFVTSSQKQSKCKSKVKKFTTLHQQQLHYHTCQNGLSVTYQHTNILQTKLL